MFSNIFVLLIGLCLSNEVLHVFGQSEETCTYDLCLTKWTNSGFCELGKSYRNESLGSEEQEGLIFCECRCDSKCCAAGTEYPCANKKFDDECDANYCDADCPFPVFIVGIIAAVFILCCCGFCCCVARRAQTTMTNTGMTVQQQGMSTVGAGVQMVGAQPQHYAAQPQNGQYNMVAQPAQQYGQPQQPQYGQQPQYNMAPQPAPQYGAQPQCNTSKY